MSLSRIVDLIHTAGSERWNERNQDAFSSLFGSPGGRYRSGAKEDFALRAPEIGTDQEAVRFAAYIHPSNPKSGRYRGLSFVMFPVTDGPSLVGLVVGTDGLSPDEAILGRPGHARKAQAICAWLNALGKGRRVAWAKQDPTRTDLEIPKDVQQEWPAYKKVFDRYGKEIYAFFCPTENRAWEPSYVGSQRSLEPDLMVEWDGLSMIVDAKYKRHFEEIQSHSWMRVEEYLREQHRHDLLQVLAYANLARTPRVIACLVYPCLEETWWSLRERRRVIHRGEIGGEGRSVTVWLTAVPMRADLGEAASALTEELRRLRT